MQMNDIVPLPQNTRDLLSQLFLIIPLRIAEGLYVKSIFLAFLRRLQRFRVSGQKYKLIPFSIYVFQICLLYTSPSPRD